QDLFAPEPVGAQMLVRRLAQHGEHPGVAQDPPPLPPVPVHHVLRAVDVLLAAGAVVAECLDLATRVGRDPDPGPPRRHGERRDAHEVLLRLHRRAVRRHVAEPFLGRADPSPPRFRSCSHLTAGGTRSVPSGEGRAGDAGRHAAGGAHRGPATRGASSPPHHHTRRPCVHGTIMAPIVPQDSGRWEVRSWIPPSPWWARTCDSTVTSRFPSSPSSSARAGRGATTRRPISTSWPCASPTRRSSFPATAAARPGRTKTCASPRTPCSTCTTAPWTCSSARSRKAARA